MDKTWKERPITKGVIMQAPAGGVQRCTGGAPEEADAAGGAGETGLSQKILDHDEELRHITKA